ncbi:transposase [Clostridium botulinum]|uniref:Transposase n=1 Tax=Clostridium botulinum TaxID=1491 RepID=A0ABD7CMR9_CLOBO|nr:transposase [Clostridium botulinum]KIN79873.1 transposase [Clostridium botulinum]QRI54391.1 transposase [Clostridium botulinum]
MAKRIYSTELKLEIVKKYLSDNVSFGMLSQECNINKEDIQKWFVVYREHGEAVLSTVNGTYTRDFKINVVEHIHNCSDRSTAAYFNIPIRGNHLNNSIMENFFGLLKFELLYIRII